MKPESRKTSSVESRLMMRKRLAEMKQVLERSMKYGDPQTDHDLIERAYEDYCQLIQGESLT